MRNLMIAASILTLAACGLNGTDRYKDEEAAAAQDQSAPDFGYETYSTDNLADTMASRDPEMAQRMPAAISSGTSGLSDGTDPNPAVPDPEDRPIMQSQVVLDRHGFGPGVIDGKMGASTSNAIEGFQEANDLEITGELDEATKKMLAKWQDIPATRVVTIPASWGSLQFAEIPDGAEKQASMKSLGYESLQEKLAERFHTTNAVLDQLNPGGKPAGAKGEGPSVSASSSPGSPVKDAKFRAGQQIRVPNVGADRIAPDSIQDKGWQQTLAALGVGSDQPQLARIVVDESEGWLKGYDDNDKLVVMFTVTSGSKNDPLPVGDWKITGVAHNPSFSYQPDLFWDVPDEEEEQMLPPGPNGPVGVVWIDLSKEHYGIHGTPDPETIGRVQSHGCVRLTNWDAARLAQMVGTGSKVVFQA